MAQDTAEVDVSSPSDGSSPVLSIFLFMFVLLAALVFYIYQENQRRAANAPSMKKKKLSKKKLAREARENRSQFSLE